MEMTMKTIAEPKKKATKNSGNDAAEVGILSAPDTEAAFLRTGARPIVYNADSDATLLELLTRALSTEDDPVRGGLDALSDELALAQSVLEHDNELSLAFVTSTLHRLASRARALSELHGRMVWALRAQTKAAE
jgi:hypothetical protein